MSVWQWGAMQNRGIREKGSKRGSLVAVTFAYVSSASNEQRLPRTVEEFWGFFFLYVFQFVTVTTLVTLWTLVNKTLHVLAVLCFLCRKAKWVTNGPHPQ